MRFIDAAELPVDDRPRTIPAPKKPATTKTPTLASENERKARGEANKPLCDMGRRFHDGLPLNEIVEVLEQHGFDTEALSGFYCGNQGRTHERVGPNTWLALSWYRFEHTGRYEVVAYLS